MPDFKMPYLRFKQREDEVSPEYAILIANADDVLSWAAIRRREDDARGPQRRLNKSKISAIRRFFSLDRRNTIPPAITVTLRVEENQFTKDGLVIKLEPDVDDNHKPGLVIDGQHRLLGLKGFGYKVAVVALLNVDDMETAFQFLVINRKATPVSPDLIRTLALDYKEQELIERLETARLNLSANLRYVGIMDSDNASPFKGQIAIVSEQCDNVARFISPAAIESCVAVVQGQNNIRELDNDDTLCEFLYAIWRVAKNEWNHLWNAESKLLQKACMVSFTTFMTKALVGRYDWGELDISDPDDVTEKCYQVLMNLSADFWIHPWKVKISDSASTRDLIIQGLEESARNMRAGREWSEGVALLDEASG